MGVENIFDACRSNPTRFSEHRFMRPETKTDVGMLRQDAQKVSIWMRVPSRCHNRHFLRLIRTNDKRGDVCLWWKPFRSWTKMRVAELCTCGRSVDDNVYMLEDDLNIRTIIGAECNA